MNHCHFECAKGKLIWDKDGSGWGFYGRNEATGVWHLQDSISADQVCVVDDVQIINGLGMNWKTSNDVLANTKETNASYVYGLDLSEHNQDLDFNALKAAGNSFVILRAGFGWSTSQRDKRFDEYYAQAKAAGMKVGCYWYSYARNLDEAKAEAECFKQVIAGKDFDMPVFVDLEDADNWKKNTTNPSGAMQAQCANLIASEMKAAGYDVGIYCSTYYIDHVYTGLDITNYHLWEANYGSNDGSIHGDFSHRAIMHQYTSQWSFGGKVFDRNVLYKELESKPQVKQEPDGSVYRLYNPNTGDHLFTANFAEAQNVANAGWTYEGVAWQSPTDGEDVYRLYQGNVHDYVFKKDVSKLESEGWTCECVAFKSGGSRPIYRMFNQNDGSCILTSNLTEHNELTKNGWLCQGQEIKY